MRKPDEPPRHLVTYFLPYDVGRDEVLLVAHRGAGLWLPPGGHVEPGEDPWGTVERECREELGVSAVPDALTGRRPLFCTEARTRGFGGHTDVTLWFLLRLDVGTPIVPGTEEFGAVRWVGLSRLLARTG